MESDKRKDYIIEMIIKVFIVVFCAWIGIFVLIDSWEDRFRIIAGGRLFSLLLSWVGIFIFLIALLFWLAEPIFKKQEEKWKKLKAKELKKEIDDIEALPNKKRKKAWKEYKKIKMQAKERSDK
ncbi:MAG: hypothetical protein COU51_05065 [Parcubacteria group bacterium CG10_big_fil_rev_8_21_14_0_10_36_14]|nr:MAG: hypothetical protein COU51_05065 [Parcubacteria group bacterium CG10_big_fil_rev_8_21_14_0_10_36_14]